MTSVRPAFAKSQFSWIWPDLTKSGQIRSNPAKLIQRAPAPIARNNVRQAHVQSQVIQVIAESQASTY
ncbi:hypothetical protein GT579_16120 [Enterococcus durans]|nr:hypothetical protein [Enterococcus durans]